MLLVLSTPCQLRLASQAAPPAPLNPQVGPGEVDAQLDGEVGEECSKYGTVTK